MSIWINSEEGPRRQSIRQERRSLRQSLTSAEVEEKSRRVAEKLQLLPALEKAGNIMAYMPFDNEVDLREVLAAFRSQGRVILLPRIGPDNNLEAVPFRENQQWQRRSFGVLEPDGAAFPREEIQSVLVPGLAFDPLGYRLGFGRGYYDRFLSGLDPRVFRCGVCYEFQVVDSVFPTDTDVPMHWVVTDHSEILVDPGFF